MDTLTVLTEARKLIATPDKWRQGLPTLDRPGTRPCCVGQAIERAAGHDPTLARTAYAAVEKHIGCSSLVCWQDEPGRTHLEVLAALDAAIAVERVKFAEQFLSAEALA